MTSLSLACSRSVIDEMCLICFTNKENSNQLSIIIGDFNNALQLVIGVFAFCYTS